MKEGNHFPALDVGRIEGTILKVFPPVGSLEPIIEEFILESQLRKGDEFVNYLGL